MFVSINLEDPSDARFDILWPPYIGSWPHSLEFSMLQIQIDVIFSFHDNSEIMLSPFTN
jgi:hypothetical protein